MSGAAIMTEQHNSIGSYKHSKKKIMVNRVKMDENFAPSFTDV